jgi:bacterioferritin
MSLQKESAQSDHYFSGATGHGMWSFGALIDLLFGIPLLEAGGDMRGSAKVFKELNAALLAELTAIVQYMVQAEMCNNWGYRRLGSLTKKRAIEEMHHAEELIERIIFLDGTPEVEVGISPKIGKEVQEQLEIDLRDELDAVKQYNASIETCKKSGDNGSRELFEKMVKDEENHIYFLEAQLQSAKEMGIANYLAQQMHKDG